MGQRAWQPAQIAEIARAQNRCVTRGQLLELGLSASAIQRLLANGTLHPSHLGVYLVGIPAASELERAAAAVLACGETAALSHLSSLALWDLDGWPAGPVSVIVTGNRHPAGVHVRRSTDLLPSERRRRHGIPVTSPARTVLDSVPRLTDARRTRVVNDALRTPYLSRAELARVRAAHPRHPGARLLDPFIDTIGGPTYAGWKDDFPVFCADHNLPEPILSTVVCGHLVDALFPAARVIVELDGWRFHNDRTSFEADRDRDADTLAGGYATVRITWRRIERQPQREAARLQTILDRRLVVPS